MKKFIFNILKFVLIIFTSIVTLLLLNYYFTLHEFEKVISKKSVIILGDSGTQCAINDSILKNSVNLSSSSEPYFLSYLKLKQIVKSNHFTDTVILSFSSHNLFTSDSTINPLMLNGCIQIYYPMMSSNDIKLVFQQLPSKIISYNNTILRSSYINCIKKLVGKDLGISFGGYLGLKRNVLYQSIYQLKHKKELPFFNMNKGSEISTFQLTYLNKIRILCRLNKIKLILINPPKRKEILAEGFYKNRQFLHYYQTYLKSTEFLDFSNMRLKDSDYGDLVHLNEHGSTFFSQFLKNKVFKN